MLGSTTDELSFTANVAPANFVVVKQEQTRSSTIDPKTVNFIKLVVGFCTTLFGLISTIAGFGQRNMRRVKKYPLAWIVPIVGIVCLIGGIWLFSTATNDLIILAM